MKEKYLELREKYSPKHIARAVKNTPDLWEHICAATAPYTDISVPERIYLWFSGESPVCHRGNKRAFKTLDDGYRQFCGNKAVCQCSRENQSEKIKTRWDERSADDKESILEKMKATNLERYGVENAAHSETVKEKTKQTVRARYGTDTPLQSADIQAKCQASMMEKYGVAHPFQDADIVSKALATQKEKYGGLMVNARKALFAKYDGNPFAHPFVKSKIRRTTLEKYGVSHNKRRHLSNSVIETLDDKEAFSAAIDGLTIAESALAIGVHERTITRISDNFGLRALFAKSTRSKWEHNISQWLTNELGLTEGSNFIRNTKDIISPLELDFYFPSHKIAVEVGSLFWHSEINGGRGRDYHKRKHSECENKGITLLQFWDDELSVAMPVVFSKIKYSLNVGNIASVGARKLKIATISDTAAERGLLNQHHIQGFTPDRSWTYGAYHNESLIGVLCIAKRSPTTHEIVRFATITSHRFVGLFSKMVQHHCRVQLFSGQLISFSDNRHGSGKLYRSAGFILAHEVDPTYYYTKDYHSRVHRRNFSKASMRRKYGTIDESKSEWEIVQGMGYDRIWDAGKKKWILNVKAPYGALK